MTLATADWHRVAKRLEETHPVLAERIRAVIEGMDAGEQATLLLSRPELWHVAQAREKA